VGFFEVLVYGHQLGYIIAGMIKAETWWWSWLNQWTIEAIGKCRTPCTWVRWHSFRDATKLRPSSFVLATQLEGSSKGYNALNKVRCHVLSISLIDFRRSSV
jgi:hypothetical protein